jgi:hypothetical protein
LRPVYVPYRQKCVFCQSGGIYPIKLLIQAVVSAFLKKDIFTHIPPKYQQNRMSPFDSIKENNIFI